MKKMMKAIKNEIGRRYSWGRVEGEEEGVNLA